MKYFVVSDVHSFYSLMKKALTEAGFDENNPNHMLIICGDAFDRGPEALLMFEYMKYLASINRLIYIKGNHEELLIKALNRGYLMMHDIHNKTFETIQALAGIKFEADNPNRDEVIFDKARESGIITFIYENARYYYETANYVFAHGFIPYTIDEITCDYVYDPDWRNRSIIDFENATWLNGMAFNIYDGIRIPDKTLVVGHFHASYGNARKNDMSFMRDERAPNEFDDISLFKPFNGDGLIAIDACTAISGFVNCIVIDD